MIGIVVKALLGNSWHMWPLISTMLHVKHEKKVFRGAGPMLDYNGRCRTVDVPSWTLSEAS